MALQLPTILGAIAASAQLVSDLSQAPPTAPLTSAFQAGQALPSGATTSRGSQQELQIPVVNDTLPLQVPKPFIILHTIDIKPQDLDNLKSYGKVVKYEQAVEGSMFISSLVFDYLCLDLRLKADRTYFDAQDTSACNVICYISLIECFDAYIENLGVQNIITEFPSRQHLAGDFNALMLKQATDEPSKCLSCITFTSNYLSSLKKTS